MKLWRVVSWLVAGQMISLGSAADTGPASTRSPLEKPRAAAVVAEAGPSSALLDALETPALRRLVAEVLDRSPSVARARQAAAAMAARAPQVRTLPDPVAAMSLFVLPPETRVGPQRLTASVQQRLPWFGKLELAEQAELYRAAASRAEVERVRLDQLTEVRRLAYELEFLDAQEQIATAERGALVRYEKAAQARYAAGTGLQQEIVRIQAQITRADTRLLEIAERRIALTAELNRLRDRPASEAAGALLGDPRNGGPKEVAVSALDAEELRRSALAYRPEVVAADARIAAAEARRALAEKSFRPDWTVGLSYTAVDSRRDTAGRLTPPEDDGDDILALTGSVQLPVRRKRLAAAVEEAQAQRWEADEAKRLVVADIESAVGDLAARIPLLARHLELLDNVLLKQAREALRSAETAYSLGQLNAIDLLDAEVVLFEVRIAAARTRADLAIARAQLERAVARPLTAFESELPT